MRTRSKVALLAVSGAIGLSFALLPGVAQAAAAAPPGSCSSGFGYGHKYTWAKCLSGIGSVRAVATCANDANRTRTVYGPWVAVGTQSSARCQSDYPLAIAHTYQTG